MSHPNALNGNNRFKLGLFGLNVDNACAITTIDGVFHPTWDNVKRLTRMADNAGFEALVPVARWRGFGGVTNFNGACFETFGDFYNKRVVYFIRVHPFNRKS